MPKELYHFVFKQKRKALNDFLPVFLIPIAVMYIAGFFANLTTNLLLYIIAPPTVIFIIVFPIALYFTRKGEDIPHEFILYDNGWFVFWTKLPDPGWMAPAKLDWLLPPAPKDRKGLEKKLGYRVNTYYAVFCCNYYRAKKKKGKYWVGFGLCWTYPSKKWENWVFGADVGGYLTEEEYKKFLEMVKYIDKKARENVERGRVKIPGKNFKQEHFEYYQLPAYWNNYVFEEENIQELYKKETGEDIPEPIRSFLFDREKFKKVYLKNKKETGDWFGRGERKREVKNVRRRKK